ncbi:hypothetical protein ABH15_02615 [Methanoculleus taiwanensis]|uniref:CARDB domain-containing protein n=1 Tax=Methanoculleus taiwanensis TaxID=1550565 RepID=A0A498H2A9_9EURY|nr:CARDB domain-containing protein [Methanoculleus taiwanensis]RXE57042.1 hypothetical protein ABH15_02615 [Methanoculleus taiwanensis]
MKQNIWILILLVSSIVGITAAAETNTAATSTATDTSPEALIAVTGVTVSPGIFMRGDTGTVAVEITNTGTEGVAISRATLYPNGVTVINDRTYDSVGTIGPGNSMTFTFTVKADTSDGIYYPQFYLDLRDGGSIRYYVPVKVESTGIQVSILDAPETYPANSKDTVTLSVGNPRENAVSGVTVVPQGEGITTTQSAVFLGALQPDAEKNVSIEVAAAESTELTFDVSYRNGINEHHATLTIPVEVGDRSVQPEPVVNNVEVAQSGTGYTLTGDVTNAGLKDAYSVRVTVDEPAKATGSYPVYVIGALEPDDFSSFEVTCSAPGASSIPLVVQYKDEDGNTFEETVTISLTGTGQTAAAGNTDAKQAPAGMTGRPGGMSMFGGAGSGFGQIPVLEIVLVVIGGVVLVVAWRKGYIGKIRDRVRNRSRK